MRVMRSLYIMRTTLSVDDNLLAAAKRRARERGQTLGRVIEDALRRELAVPAQYLDRLAAGDRF